MTAGQAQAAQDAEAFGTTRISFQALGGNGPNALLLHGFGSDRMSWLANQTALEGVVNLFALDLPGHGASGMEVGDGGVEALAARVAALLDRRALRKLHLTGHSLGGGVALMLAAARPELVASLALIAPAGLGQAIDASFLAAFPELSTPEASEALLRRLVVRPRLIGKPLIALVLEQLAKPGARQALRLIARGIEKGGAALDAAAARVAATALPRLIVWGENDAINPLSREKLAAFGGDLRLVAGAAHLPHVENPRLVNEEIVSFLTRVGGA
jgi:pimeloyl-ACP methyl ester carboxylesterase